MDDWLDRLVIYAADVGKIPSKFGWARGAGTGETSTDDDIHAMAASVGGDLRDGKPVALGFECPLFVPVRSEPAHLLQSRDGEGQRPWSAAAGAQSLVVGLVETAWLLRNIRAGLSEIPPVFLEWSAFATARGGLVLWEAFVSGPRKGRVHLDDARLAVMAFRRALPSPVTAVAGVDAYAIVAAAALYAGWSTDLSLLHQSGLVVRA